MKNHALTKSRLRLAPLIGLLALSVSFAGCSKTVRTVDDSLWSGGRFQAVIRELHYKSELHGFGYSENSDKLTGQTWNYFDHSLAGPSGATVRKNHFFTTTGPGSDNEDIFVVMGGSDLLIHEKLDFSGVTQCMVFDPATGRDISKPFYPVKGRMVFNRLRTAALAMTDGQAVLYDLLSARSGDLKTLPRPAWTAPLLHSQAPDASVKILLTSDSQQMVMLTSNRLIEAYAADGTTQTWTVPASRDVENFADAELVGGKTLLFSIQITYNDADLRISDMQGAILYSRRVPAQTILAPHLDPRWDPSRNEILCLPTQFSPGDPEHSFALWNYTSNTLETVPSPW